MLETSTTGEPRGWTVWLTGLPAAGKSTLADHLADALTTRGRRAAVLDGDALRAGPSADLGFGRADRAESVRRAGLAALETARTGAVVVVALVSPFAVDRARVRAAHAAAEIAFVEVWVDTPLAVCERRDPKGLYARARRGQLREMTGVDDPYERPWRPSCGWSRQGARPRPVPRRCWHCSSSGARYRLRRARDRRLRPRLHAAGPGRGARDARRPPRQARRPLLLPQGRHAGLHDPGVLDHGPHGRLRQARRGRPRGLARPGRRRSRSSTRSSP